MLLISSTLKKINIYPAYISKQNSNHEKNYSFNETKPKRIALSCIKKFIWLQRGIRWKHADYLYVLNCKEKSNLNIIKKVFQKKNVCSIVIPSDDTKIIKFNQ